MLTHKRQLPPKSPKVSPAPSASRRKALLLQLAFTGLFLALGFCSRARTNPHLAWTFLGVAAGLGCWQWLLFRRSQSAARTLSWEFAVQRSHYVQALLQFAIYGYWGWYWPDVFAEVPLILSQIAFLYVFDGLLSWSRGLPWRIGFGVWPIILSTNLFIWFRDDWYVFQFLTLALALLGKHYIRWRRDGKLTHIFNPSAFALAVVSLGLLFTGTTDHTWGVEIASTQDIPPRYYTLIFLTGIVVQYFFSVTLMTFSAMITFAVVNFIYFQATGTYFFFNANISTAVFLAAHLLMTDPATTPRCSIGKIAFGGLYGVGVCVTFWILEFLEVPNISQKLLVVPLLNLMTPLLDRWAKISWLDQLGRWEALVPPRRMNLVYMGCWTSLFLVMRQTGYIEAPHLGDTLHFWVQAAEDKRYWATKRLQAMLNFLDEQHQPKPPGAHPIPHWTSAAAGSPNDAISMAGVCNEAGKVYAEGKLIKGDPAKARFYFTKACKSGNREAGENLVIQYVIFGQIEAEADARWVLDQLENDPEAMAHGQFLFVLGYAYETGRGREMNKVKARQYYEKSATLGYWGACPTLALMLLTGNGGLPDPAAAARWLQKAADQNDGASCFYLAGLYYDGNGVPRDVQHARTLLEKACNLGVPEACKLLQPVKQ